MIRTRLKSTVRAAMQIALKTGVLTRCPHHWVYLRNTDDAALEHAFRLGNFLISHFAKSVACFKGDRRQLADAILRCREDADTTCPLCG